MSIDIAIISSAFFSFLSFFLIQSLIFRFIDPRAVFKWIIYIYFTGLFFAGLIGFKLLQIMPLEILLLVFSLSCLLYSLMVFVYVIGIFGVIESSIRIRILELITTHPGMTKVELVRHYNSQSIIDKRLSRLIASGELQYFGGTYALTPKLSFLRLLTLVIKFMFHAYGVKTN